MREHKLNLINHPTFLHKNIESIEIINFNSIFREYIFYSKELKRKVLSSNHSGKNKENIIFIISNLEASYNIFKLYKYKDIGVESLIFAFNIIYDYLNIINRISGGVIIKFYNSIILEESAFRNIKNTLFYNFYKKYVKLLDNIKDGDILTLNIETTQQASQLEIIKNILEEKGVNIKFNIYLGRLYEFENKLNFKKFLENKFSNINKISINSSFLYYNHMVFGSVYYSSIVFGKGCSWRKCSFCNIGKFQEIGNGENNNEKIEYLINYIKKNNIKFLNIRDSTIEFDDLLSFAKAIIKEGISINIHIRTRLSDDFTYENCKILGKAGFKFIGFGLESASKRLNNLMKKYEKDYSENDFQKVINNCLNNSISVHIYTIFSLPSETKKEALETYNFLEKNINKNNFFSFTAGIFGLNRGTDVYNNPEKYGIKLLEEDNITKTHIDTFRDLSAEEGKREYTLNLRKKIINKLFFGDLKNNIKIFGFWYFIENSKIFHYIKMVNEKNTFLNDLEIANEKDENLIKLKYIQFLNDKKTVKNWITKLETELTEDEYDFLKNYNNNLNLYENLKKYKININNLDKFFQRYLIIKNKNR